MAAQKARVVLPQHLVAQIDALVGARGRSAFLTKLAEKELKRCRLLAFLQSDEPVWKDEDHPELAAIGTEAWVRKLRAETSEGL